MKTITKAYDAKELQDLLKEELGPDLGQYSEVIAKKVYASFKHWTVESAKISVNKFDDVCAPMAFNTLDVIILPAIDQFDGIKGN